MFVSGTALVVGDPAADWEPIPDAELASLPPLADPAGTDTAENLPQLLVDLTRQAARVEAQRLAVIAAIAGPEPANRRAREDDFAANEVALAAHCSLPAADRLVALGRDLACRLIATGDALAAGDITAMQARALHDAALALPDDVANAVEQRVLRRAPQQSIGEFRASLRRAVARLDPTFAERAREARRSEARVVHTPLDDGTGELFVRGPLEVTAIVHTALLAYAAATKQLLGGTAEQRMIVGIRDAAQTYLSSPNAPTHHGRPPTVNVVIDLCTLLGLRDTPAEIPGVGPLPAEAAVGLLAGGASLRRLVTDPITGHLLDYGRSCYTVPRDLADYLIARHVTSAGPHSAVPAAVSDLDHRIPYAAGGATDRTNLTPLDRRWHRARTHGDWTYSRAADGAHTWTSPCGLTCRVEPHDYGPGP